MSIQDGKRGPGQKIHQVPAATWNGMVEAGLAFNGEQLRGGQPPSRRPIETDVVNVLNDTGSDLTRGEVICLGDLELDALEPGFLWFAGSQPTTTELPYGVLLEPIPDGVRGRVQVSGVCLARIDKIYDSHPYAHITSGDTQLQTDWHGQAEILAKKEHPDVSGQWWAAVRLGNYRSVILDVVVTQSGGIAFGASGSVEVWRAGAVTSPVQTIQMTFRHVGVGRTLAVATKVKTYYDNSDKKWVVLSADCP